MTPGRSRRFYLVTAEVIRWGAIGNVVLRAGLLAMSLLALAYNRNVLPQLAAIVLAVSGILLLALIVSAVPAYRKMGESMETDADSQI